MKSAVAFLGLAAMANAMEFPKHAEYHHKRSNYTEPAVTSAAAGSGSDYTTVTVYSTQVRTVTSCAPTVTNCPAQQTAIDQLPANQKHVVYVTDTVVLTETVCPVSEAGKVSSSVIEQAQTGGITPQYTITATAPGKTTTPAAAAIPLSTGYSSPVTDSDSSGGENTSLTTLVSTTTIDKTLTLTIGNEVTTTTVQSTIETTVTVPCSQVTDQAVKSGEDNSGVTPTKGSGNSYGQGSSATEDTTTTVTGTKTITVTLTVSPSGTATGVSGGDNSGENNGYATAQSTPSSTAVSGGDNSGTSNGSSDNSGSEGSCECNGATATVTVTQPASTVYVTIGTEAAKTTSAYTSESTGSNNSGNDEDDDEEDDDYCEDDITTTLQATVTVVPYPINGTTAAPTGYAKPSGFARLVR